MPRPKKEGKGEPKKRSRTGCWPCKARKVKCGEEKPSCANCVKNGETCDYSIRLNWGGRTRREQDDAAGGMSQTFTFSAAPTPPAGHARGASGPAHEHIFSAHQTSPAQRPPAGISDGGSVTPTSLGTENGELDHSFLDPRLRLAKLQEDQPQPQYELPSYAHFAATVASAAESSPPAPIASMGIGWSNQHSAKRIKLSPRTSQAVPSHMHADNQVLNRSTYPTPPSIDSVIDTPPTAKTSDYTGSPYPPAPSSLAVHDTPDTRRLSVRSLLVDPVDGEERPRYPRTDSSGFQIYGYDHGLPDLDIPRNNDHASIQPRSPDMRRASAAMLDAGTPSGEVDARLIAFEPGGYYARPVAVSIPRVLEPLPQELLNNAMNLLYFHHFLNHTARIMVPHGCPENPLRTVLPQMAVRNSQLLHLLLAFSASHRARLLGHAEPANRIADWMSDVLPALRQALDAPSSPGAADPTDATSLAPLATAIMLASLEIVSPNTFAVPISWQDHLQVARQMIVAKGGLHHLAQQANGARDKAIFFLSRWFAYLDVLGSLSGAKHAQPLYGAYCEDGGGLWLVNRSDEETYQIDCFFGFSGRCLALLAGVAELVYECQSARIDPETRQPKPDWHPSEDIRIRAQELKVRFEASAKCVYRGCMHSSAEPSTPSHENGAGEGDKTDTDIAEIYATNDAYHAAGLLHLARRVLDLPPTHPEVRKAVTDILNSLSLVRKGSTAESCLLFPIFIAGCEATDDGARQVLAARLGDVEGWGMQHLSRAKALMRRVWETGEGWEGMVGEEFFG